ncbi:SIR2 family NAD-dependent protein deacylase [Azomonas macrocytogenes]|uniref:NAD-dependent protein deacylase n=1 Tax=Azomonas macrocytogenes TaxID=69962 RepID=A0A839T6V5_AZOMA|nr:NAD-dependent deacylase [Azomonas macrocytogenes]MBB3104809.1 NAD-dependent deacetylase [Azomonas macrocytogenes]
MGAGSFGSIPLELIEGLRSSRHVVVFTGAGVSAESGVPTFRDALTGLWARYDPLALATPEAFQQDPDLVWGWYEWRRLRTLQASPNPAHHAIAELARRVPRLTLITQNVDDLHERAGCQDVLHLHGSLHHPRCFNCAAAFNGLLETTNEPPVEKRQSPPCCPICSGPVRPGVVWFGEALPEKAMHEAFAAASECDLLLSVGTSGAVYPAALIPSLAWQGGALVAHINPQPSSLHSVREYNLTGFAGEVLPALLDAVF